MSAQMIVPTLLAQYLTPPTSSLTVLTGTLGTTTPWLLLRFLYCVAGSRVVRARDADEKPRPGKAVVVVSWLHSATFWSEGVKKLGINAQNVTFVDALSRGLNLGSRRDPLGEDVILQALGDGSKEKCLVLDGPDLALAATGCDVQQLNDMIYTLREKCDSLIVTLHADAALLQRSQTPIEVAHATFTMSLVHQARMVMSLRELDSGAARDVSGVLRVTAGGDDAAEEPESVAVEEMECLYWVGIDGSVKVFERGN